MASRSPICLIALLLAALSPGSSTAGDAQFINFETAPVHPLDLSPNRSTLAACNLPDGRLELFDVSGPDAAPAPIDSIPVGIDPVSVRFRTDTELWVVNHISDSISVISLSGGPGQARVIATIDTLDTPADVVFAGSPLRAFVSCSRPNVIQVFDPPSRQLLTNVVIDAERPKALAVSPDGRTVYAAIFESGNGTTLVGAQFKNQLFVDNVIGLSNAPSAGRNPAPNAPEGFQPPLNPTLPTNPPPPGSGLIVRRNSAGRWLDDTGRDWTEFVTGTNAPLTQRVSGWDLPDRDVAMLQADTFELSYVTGLMNINMAVAANPVSGQIAVVGTDARNEVRFEPNLRGNFARVMLALVPPAAPAPGAATGAEVADLNPHLDYQTSAVPPEIRDLSIGDPRALAWTADGATAYVAGMGSRNVIVINADGTRRQAQPIEVGDGPCGLALDDARHRLYVYHRFSSSVSVIDTRTDRVVDVVMLFDPTPLAVAAGRRHLYDTRRTSGLGHVSCATCHVDARMDRLAWDLGNPAGDLNLQLLNQDGMLVTNTFHPMKGAMLTQTLQDIVGHEPFHWRGDRPDIEAFNPTFPNLQGRPEELTGGELRELRDFLSSVRIPPNPFRALDNSLPVSLPLPGHSAAGLGLLPAGAPLPPGNALAGITAFNRAANFCNTCHTLPTGLGPERLLAASLPQPVPPGPPDAHHFPVSVRLEGSLRAKNAQFRNLADRIGMDTTRPSSRAGFGFGHDGSIDSLTRFLVGLRIVDDQEIANLIALLLAIAGADVASPDAAEDPTPPAAVGRQFTLSSPAKPPQFDLMLALARSSTSRVDVIAKGRVNRQSRGWFFDRAADRFQSDRAIEQLTPEQLLAQASPGQELTFTVVARGTGRRLGIDRDLDGRFDADEQEAGTNPADPLLQPDIQSTRAMVPIGIHHRLDARIPPLAAAGTLAWLKDGQPLAGETNASLDLDIMSFAQTGDYSVQVTNAYQTLISPPFHLEVVPLLVTVNPPSQAVRQGSNAVLAAEFLGSPPVSQRWQFNDRDLPDATADRLTVTNLQRATEGFYRLIAENIHGRATSAPVWVGVLISPRVVFPPLNQTATPGADATFSFTIDGHPPPFGFQLRRSTTLVTNYVSPGPDGFLTLFNVQSTAAGSYRIVVTNAANPSPGLSLGPVTLSLLADFDRDGLPDVWEASRGLNTNDNADASLDLDEDGSSNYREYLAGTDPFDPNDVLRIDQFLRLPTGATVLQFNVASNRIYTVERRPALVDGPGSAWQTWSRIVAASTNRLVRLTNSTPQVPEEYFRVTTP